MSASSLALIINTYEQPDYLGRVLRAVSAQTSCPEEVVLADDGSGEDTRALFATWAAAQPFHCEHAWQEHDGFRRAKVLNEAIARTSSDLLVFLDGDTVPHPAFVQDHREVAQEAHFTQGHRCLVQSKAAVRFGRGAFPTDRARALVLLQLSGLSNAFRWPRAIRRQREDLRGIRGCNLAIWRADLVRVNGYNEDFQGWGREDSELAVRLLNNQVLRQDVRGRCLCYHLWHPPADRARLQDNDALLAEAVASGRRWCPNGLTRHACPQHNPAGARERTAHE